jgi:hypothetical protein
MVFCSHKEVTVGKASTLLHNILELALGRPSSYNAKYCKKSLLKKDFIPFLSNYAHFPTSTCMFLLLR